MLRELASSIESVTNRPLTSVIAGKKQNRMLQYRSINSLPLFHQDEVTFMATLLIKFHLNWQGIGYKLIFKKFCIKFLCTFSTDIDSYYVKIYPVTYNFIFSKYRHICWHNRQHAKCLLQCL
jgi:hypothetical protein